MSRYERKKREGVMLAYPFEESRLQRWNVPLVITQPKLDGFRCRALRTAEGVVLLSSTNDVVFSVPHVNESLMRLPVGAHLDGELYTHGLSFEEISSLVSRTVNLLGEASKIEYHVFDIVDFEEPQGVRLAQLEQLFQNFLGTTEVVKQVESTICHATTEAILKQMNHYVERGYEGIIVRHPAAGYKPARSTHMMKFKPSRSDYYLVVGVKEEVDKYGVPKGRLGALLCTSLEHPGEPEFAVGTGFTHEQRVALWEIRDQLPGMLVHVSYQHTTQGGKPRFPVFCSLLNPDEVAHELLDT
ncbi:MAG: hypothetical protein KatS3mg015_2748 [Fimbriimonadales bacterium]|nr:MAG: hypothetical protein KatS3mg015_2748 [Fimbriimonadales bacterium]